MSLILLALLLPVDGKPTIELSFVKNQVPADLKVGEKVNISTITASSINESGVLKLTTKVLAEDVVVLEIRKETKSKKGVEPETIKFQVTKEQLVTLEKMKKTLVNMSTRSTGGNYETKKLPVPLRVERPSKK